MRNKLDFLKILWSPFKPFKLKWYVGETRIGTPYFYPRRWVKNSDGSESAVPKKIGFDFVGLGWKTKYDDYRFEWSPVFSFVFFGYQSAIMVYSPYESQYWEAWLYYDRNTDKTKSKRERIEQCRKEYPQTYEVWEKGEEGKIIDYYDLILRKKYLK